VADKLQFGLIGCGSQGRFLSEGLKMTDKADLVACADPNSEAAQTALDHAAEFNIWLQEVCSCLASRA